MLVQKLQPPPLQPPAAGGPAAPPPASAAQPPSIEVTLALIQQHIKDIKDIRNDIKGVRNDLKGVRDNIKGVRDDIRNDIKGAAAADTSLSSKIPALDNKLVVLMVAVSVLGTLLVFGEFPHAE